MLYQPGWLDLVAGQYGTQNRGAYNMDKFIDLPVSYFDPEFTLDPYPFLEDLYARDDVLGFRSEGMEFLFRHEDCRAELKSPLCRREPLANR